MHAGPQPVGLEARANEGVFIYWVQARHTGSGVLFILKLCAAASVGAFIWRHNVYLQFLINNLNLAVFRDKDNLLKSRSHCF